MKKITFANGVALLLMVFALCSCGKESTNSIDQLEDHVEEHEGPNVEAMEMTQANLDILNFEVENGILAFQSVEDLQKYRQEVSILTDQERNDFEAKHGFKSLRSITQQILDKSSSITSKTELEAFLEEHKYYVELINNSLEGKFTAPGISLNENRFVKVGDTYNYYDEEKIMASSNLRDLKTQINSPDLQIEGINISFYKDWEISNHSIIEDRDDDVTLNNCFVLSLDETHNYTGDGKNRRMLLEADYITVGIFMNSTLIFWTEFRYVLKNRQRSLGFVWLPRAVGLLGEFDGTSVSQFSVYDVTNEIATIVNMPNTFNGNSFLNNFNYVYGSCWGPTWHRSGCN